MGVERPEGDVWSGSKDPRHLSVLCRTTGGGEGGSEVQGPLGGHWITGPWTGRGMGDGTKVFDPSPVLYVFINIGFSLPPSLPRSGDRGPLSMSVTGPLASRPLGLPIASSWVRVLFLLGSSLVEMVLTVHLRGELRLTFLLGE